MKRNIYLITITIITIACIILGSMYHGIGLVRTVTRNIISGTDNEETTSVNDNNIDAFTIINVDTDVANLNITTGNSYSCKITSVKKYPVTYTNENGELRITQSSHNVVSSGWGSFTCRIDITVPADAQIERADIKSDVGNIDVDGCNIKDIIVETNVGNIDLSNNTFTNLTVTSDIGNIDISGVKDVDSFNTDISTDLGKVKYCGSNSKGSINKTVASPIGYIKIESDVGNINLN
ncbi:MAG: DUF4097 family beta strand repeat-containing protein [Lachnospiraceae bacterium]